MERKIWTLSDVCNHFRVHPSTIYRAIRRKQLLAWKLGRDWRFNAEAIERFERERTIDPRTGEAAHTPRQ